MTSQNPEVDYRRLWRAAFSYASRRGYSPEFAEDFAQDMSLAVWQGAPLNFQREFCDFLRRQFGRTGKYGSEGTNLKALALSTMESYEELSVGRLRL